MTIHSIQKLLVKVGIPTYIFQKRPARNIPKNPQRKTITVLVCLQHPACRGDIHHVTIYIYIYIYDVRKRPFFATFLGMVENLTVRPGPSKVLGDLQLRGFLVKVTNFSSPNVTLCANSFFDHLSCQLHDWIDQSNLH